VSFDSYFFARPSFLRGMARAIDITGVLSREAVVIVDTPEEADANALASDVAVIGRDLQRGLDTFEPIGTKA
jgi:hypothetical protein